MTTPECNLCCKYCGGSLHGMSQKVQYPIEKLSSFIAQDTDAVVAFYGGEPLLEPTFIKNCLDQLPAKHFVINTNGYFIQDLGDTIHQFDSILLSIDGRKAITDYYRESGCYDKVVSAVRFLKENQYEGDLIARMSVSHKTDIYEDVTHLLSLFPYVHWQLDMIWSPLWELPEFQSWARTNYNPGIHRLVSEWVDTMIHGDIKGIVPFLGIVSRMLYGGSGLFCQSGTHSITITTDGTILGCPIAPDYTWNVLGDISSGFHTIDIQEPCIHCPDYQLCGGRCLFAHIERLWGKEGFEEMCFVTRFLINELQNHLPVYTHHKERLLYPLYNNTTEIIP